MKIWHSTFPRLAVAVTLALAGGAALAQQNSPEATAAAKKHLAEKSKAAAAPTAKTTQPAKPASAPAPAGDWNARLVACKNEAGMNLVKREKCVYAHCKGHWGEGDCPPGQDMPTKDSFKNPFKKSS